jgi:lipid A ethanolaminephosphotransferase
MKLNFLPFRRPNRPTLTPLALNVVAATFIMAVYNHTFWTVAADAYDHALIPQLTIGLSVWALTLLVLTVLGFRWLQKPVLAFLLILSAVTSWYMDTLGVFIDRNMIQNAATTTVNEAKHLITPAFIRHVALFGVLPAIGVYWVRLRQPGLWRNAWTTVATAVACVMLFAGFFLVDLKSKATVLRERKDLAASIQPLAPMSGALRYAKLMLVTRRVTVAEVGRDARKGPLLASAQKPVVTIIVAGETARAQNFGIDGYSRDTTPELEKHDIINFPDTESCGTATATSLPCMFSRFDRRGYSFRNGISNENLLDVLSHAGFDVEWWENNTGDKSIADRVKTRRFTDLKDPEHCQQGECIDSIFLDALRERVATIETDTVLVLHQIGSHGPAYFLRYPPEMERFAPSCNTAEFDDCKVEQIVNAYDNTIAYTDYILARVMDILDAQDNIIPALIYVSDHGESLGESGLFLHGAPYFMAPEEQTHVPMLMWFSERFKSTLRVDDGCLRNRAQAPVSHDNLFHTVLGLLDVQTRARQVDHDLTAGCHKTAALGPG